MVYMGSKNKISKDIAPIINKYIKDNNIKYFYDCFCGGANLIDKIKCENLIASDLSPTLIALHRQAQSNFDEILQDGSRELWDIAYNHYKAIKKKMENSIHSYTFANKILDDNNYCDMKLSDIGTIEWYGSYNNGGFGRGYAKNSEKTGRNYFQEARRNHKKQAEKPNYQKIEFLCHSYDDKKEFVDLSCSLLYCDSPYQSTTTYGISPKFDFVKYHKWLWEVSAHMPIFVSEQFLPEKFDKYIIFTKEVNRTTGKTNKKAATEKLWLIDRRNEDE